MVSSIVVTSLPSSNSNKGACYARAEYRNASGQRRVLVWQADPRTEGRSGFVALRDGLGAQDLPGTRAAMSADELIAFLVRLEAAGRTTVAGEEIVFPADLKRLFIERCRARLDDARSGRLSKTGSSP